MISLIVTENDSGQAIAEAYTKGDRIDVLCDLAAAAWMIIEGKRPNRQQTEKDFITFMSYLLECADATIYAHEHKLKDDNRYYKQGRSGGLCKMLGLSHHKHL